jgi:hypothetical protein
MTKIHASALAFISTLMAAACGDSGSTELGSPPTAIVPISLAIDTVVTGENTDPPIAVRVEGVLGNVVEGAPVRFVLTKGEGSLSPGVAVSSEDGVAESVFRAGTTPGESTIRVDIPSAPNVSSLQFVVLTEAADSVVLSVVSGTGQQAEFGSQLPLPFVVQTKTTSGNPAGAVKINFRLSTTNDSFGLLTNQTLLTNTDGVSSTVLTLGSQLHDYRVDAFANGGVYSDTVTFIATATTTFEGAIRLDSVGEAGLRAGDQATLFGQGFSPIPDENEVRIEGKLATVLSASGTGLTIQVPSFSDECLPLRNVGIRVTVNGEPSNGPLLPLHPQEASFDLAVGETATVTGPSAVSCLQFSPSQMPREFRLVVGNASSVVSDGLTMRVATRVPTDLTESGASTPNVPRQLDGVLQADAIDQYSRLDMVIRARTLQGLTEGGNAPSPASLTEMNQAIKVPVLGDTLSHFFAVGANLQATCSDTTNVVRSLVRSVGEHVILAEDVAAPPGGLDADEWRTLGTTLDQTVVPVDTSYFGHYEDIDTNRRIVVLFTQEVNKLSEGDVGVQGFFLPLDLASSGRNERQVLSTSIRTCSASNEAEVIYTLAADPEGQAGPGISKSEVIQNVPRLVAHELQHLIQAERRILHSPTRFSEVEDEWLDEALSGLAEEVVGLTAAGFGVRGDYKFDQLTDTQSRLDAFNTYHFNNFLNLSLYMFDPNASLTIRELELGGINELQMRGFGWFLMRWLADQSAGDERAFFRSLVGGGQNFTRGITNVERVTGLRWHDILSDFAVTLATDDSGIEELSNRFEVATWDFRDVFSSLNQNATARSFFPVTFPLQATQLSFDNRAVDINLGASSVRYFALTSGIDAPALSFSIRTPAGSFLNESTRPQVTIVRTR